MEAVFFAITVVISLTFLTQISPTTIQAPSQSSSELKTLGDNALSAIYKEKADIKSDGDIFSWEGIYGEGNYTTNNPTNKLAVYIITNNYDGVVDYLNLVLPDTVIYNIYISNGTKTVFWCASDLTRTSPSEMNDPVAISHQYISMAPQQLAPQVDKGFKEEIFLDGDEIDRSDIYEDFVRTPLTETPYLGATYDVILEMSYIYGS